MMIGSKHETSKGRRIENEIMAILHNKCLRDVIHHSPLSALHIRMVTHKTHVQTASLTAFSRSNKDMSTRREPDYYVSVGVMVSTARAFQRAEIKKLLNKPYTYFKKK
jgi:hypothetical protein